MPSQHSYFHIRCRGQVVRQRSAKPSLPSSNLGGTSMIAEHYRWNGKKASHLKGFGNFLFSKFLGNSIDEIADGRGFEPLLFHIQGIFAVSALFQRAAAAGFRKNWRKIFHKVMGAGLLVFTNQWPAPFLRSKRALRMEVYCMIAKWRHPIDTMRCRHL